MTQPAVKVTTKEPLIVEWWSESNHKWYGTTDEDIIKPFRESALHHLMNETSRYIYYYGRQVRVSYYEGRNPRSNIVQG